MKKTMLKNPQKELNRLVYLTNTLRDARYLASIMSLYKCEDKDMLLVNTLVTNFVHKLEEELKTFSPDIIHEAIQHAEPSLEILDSFITHSPIRNIEKVILDSFRDNIKKEE